MRPPPDRQLDLRGDAHGPAGAAHSRSTASARWHDLRGRDRCSGLLSTTLAWQFTRFFGQLVDASLTLVILNFT